VNLTTDPAVVRSDTAVPSGKSAVPTGEICPRAGGGTPGKPRKEHGYGYAYTYNSLTDPMDGVFTSSADRPCVTARQPCGSITIANSDAAASLHADAAFLEASRAVGEVLERRSYRL